MVVKSFLTMNHDPSVPLLNTVEKPLLSRFHDGVLTADFGNAVFGNVRIETRGAPLPPYLTLRLGEKRDTEGRIDRNPPGNVNVREVTLSISPGQKVVEPVFPPKEFHLRPEPVKMPDEIGEVTPFRYVEVEGLEADFVALTRLFVHAPFDDSAADFACSDKGLNAVWALCKHTIKATTAFGVYIDGERERIPYEADAYINMLSHYACDLDPRVARATVDHLLAHPTWPTEWSHHMPMMAAMDYLYTGELDVATKHYEALKAKLLMEKARADGLLVASAIVDWPALERDNYNHGITDPDNPKQVGLMVNTVANAFYLHALGQMALLADALGNANEARDFRETAAKVKCSFQRAFFDPARGLYTDGEGSDHTSQHANFFPLAFGLVPEPHIDSVADFIVSKGMACSVYGAQYLLEALFAAGRADHAIGLMAARGPRSWRRMIEEGSTMTWEAWGPEFKPNLTWNHAWGAAPANIISRFVLGVRPLNPGFSKILIAPRLGPLKWVRGAVPTPNGPVMLDIEGGAAFRIHVEIPDQSSAHLCLPQPDGRSLMVDGQLRSIPPESQFPLLSLSAGKHVILLE